LLFAAVAVAAPSVSVVLLLSLAILAAVRPKRAGVLIWVPVLGAALFAPYVWFMVSTMGQAFALLSDPGLPVDSAAQSFWQVLVGVPNGLPSNPANWGNWQRLELWPAMVAVAGFAALLAKRALVALGLIGVAIAAAGLGFAVQESFFASLEVHGSAAPATAVIAICLLLAAGLGLESIAQNHKKIVGLGASFALVGLLAASLASFGFDGVLAQNKPMALGFSDGRTVPAIVAAEAAQGSHLRVLKIARQGDKFVANLFSPEGLQLEANSTAYRLVLAQTSASEPRYLAIDALVANLVSANGTDLTKSLAAANIGFVLVPEANSADLNSALNSISELDLVGQTDFGWLWRVKAAKDNQPTDSSWRQTWSFTKGIQLLFILIFMLLAIPGPPKRRAKNTGNIFEANDFAEGDFTEDDFTDGESIEGSSESERS
jgi:hypothetical protein